MTFSTKSHAKSSDAGTRHRLVEGATRVFSRMGYEMASTRLIAEEAQVNLAAIPYYFGSKEALYAAVVDEIGNAIVALMQPVTQQVQGVLDQMNHEKKPLASSTPLLMEALGALVDAHVAIAMGDEMRMAAPILAREQVSPSSAFPALFAKAIRPPLDLAATLIGRLLHKSPDSAEVRVKAYALLGMAVHIGYARQSFAHYTDESLLSPRRQSHVRGWIQELVLNALKH